MGTASLFTPYQENKEANLKLAFELAFEHLGVPKLLDVEDMLSKPDEQAIITYLSLFPKVVAFCLCCINCQQDAAKGFSPKVASDSQTPRPSEKKAAAKAAAKPAPAIAKPTPRVVNTKEDRKEATTPSMP